MTDARPRTAAPWLLMGVAVVALALLTPARTVAYLHDQFIVLEGAYRLQNGLRIHGDFKSPMGPSYPGLLWIGMKIAGRDAAVFRIVAALIGALVVAVAAVTLPRRMPLPWALGIAGSLALLATTPSAIGVPDYGFWEGFSMTTYAMQYNRIFYALTALVAVIAGLPPENSSRRREAGEAILLGILLAFLFFGKLNFGLVAGLLVLFGWVRRRFKFVYLFYGLGGVLAMTIVFLTYANLQGFWDDMRRVSRSQSGDLRNITLGGFIAVAKANALVCGAAALALAWVATRKRETDRGVLLFVAGLTGLGIWVTFLNFQTTDLPLVALGIAILAALTRSRPVVALAVVLVGVGVARDLTLFGYAWTSGLRGERTVPSRNALLASFRTIEGSKAANRAERIEALDQAVLSAIPQGVVVASFSSNPFIGVLGGRPPARNTLWYHENHTISLRTMPEFVTEAVTAGAFVVTSRNTSKTDEIAARLYGKEVAAVARPVARTQDDIIFLRREPGTGKVPPRGD